MPTENEKKYALKIEALDEIRKNAATWYDLRQGYLFSADGIAARVRETIDQSEEAKYTFTYKHKVNHRLVEIETEIDNRDFEDLYSQTIQRLEKTRYILIEKKAKEYVWEIDFFKTNDREIYFALAEHEMPELCLNPDFIPDTIRAYLLYEAKLDDDILASKRLADVEYAKTLYTTFTELCYEQKNTEDSPAC